jgi:hypothetical protein
VVIGWFSNFASSQIAGIDSTWQDAVGSSIQREFSSEPARRWLRAWVAGMDETMAGTEICEIVEKAVQDDSGNFRRSQYELLLANE